MGRRFFNTVCLFQLMLHVLCHHVESASTMLCLLGESNLEQTPEKLRILGDEFGARSEKKVAPH